MKPYCFNFDVHIFDTDCYGVVWHGSYTKWLEMGRVNMLKTVDLDLEVLKNEHDIIFPVVEQQQKFRAAAHVGDVLTLSTRIHQEGFRLIFPQEIRNLHSHKLILEAKTTVVLINGQDKVYRQIPAVLQDKLSDLENAS